MALNNTWVIARREYLSRIKTKGFWIGTFLLPAFILAVSILPSVFLARTKTSLRLAVVDETGRVATPLVQRLKEGKKSEETPAQATRRATQEVQSGRPSSAPPQPKASFDVTVEARQGEATAQRAALDSKVLDQSIDAWLWIGTGTLETGKVEYHGVSVSNVVTQERLENALTDVVRDLRLTDAGYDPVKVHTLLSSVDLSTVKVSAEGSKAEGGVAGFLLAYILFFLLYMIIAIYGQQVMTGVLEEKSSRIVEVILSAVKPSEMMLGKLAGIGAVGLTQLAIWLATLLLVTAPALGLTLAFIPGGIPTLPLAVVGHFLLLFVLGYFLFATFYAAIGSAFNDIREAQQAGASAMFLLVPPMLLGPMIINDPDSTLSVAMSLVPFFTPLLMMLRIAVKMPPLWQILLGYVLTTATVLFMLWVCAKIYRVGILMYGKKPTFKELLRWVKYA
ncbi:MAG: ABC transporter permease [Acidobacteriota bacterium]